MDVLAAAHLSPVRDYDRIAEIRAAGHEDRRGRKNVTSCRSPTRYDDTRQIKNELRDKRQLEFLRRRLASSWSEQVTLIQPPTSSLPMKESHQHITRGETSAEGQQTSVVETVTQTEFIQQTSSHTEKVLSKKTFREASGQTLSGLITVRESDIQQLAEYLQDALWREEAVKKKLAALQESTSDLINSSSKIWTTRCNDDLLRNQIQALEAQLQVCLQKFPKDGVKKVLTQMERQKMEYEEKALVALQKATQEKTEALCKAGMLQESLTAAEAEALKWQSQYEGLKLSSARLKDEQLLGDERLQHLHGQVELAMAGEAELRGEVVSLTRENEELQDSISLLEEDKQRLEEEILKVRGGSDGSEDVVTPEEVEQQLRRTDSQVEEQLRFAQENLRLKESECEELQTGLHAMEQECLSSQARLSQCRDELRQLSHRHRRPTACGCWWKTCMFFLLFFIAVAGVAMLWLRHPPFRDQLEDLYSDIETRIEDFLLEMASPDHSRCLRPI